MSCGGGHKNPNYRAISAAAREHRLKVDTTARVFHALVRAAREDGDSDPVGFARAALDKAAERHHQHLLARSRGSWPTYNWSGTFDADAGIWQLHPEPEPDREPPGVDWRTRFAEQAVREGRLIEVRTNTDPNSGDGYLFTPDGARVWGRFGAAGVLYRSRDSAGEPVVLLAQRGAGLHAAGQWGIPGGARDTMEDPAHAAAREFSEEVGVSPLTPGQVGRRVQAERIPGRWTYTSTLIDVEAPFSVPRRPCDGETAAVAWVRVSTAQRAARDGRMHAGLARSLHRLLAD